MRASKDWRPMAEKLEKLEVDGIHQFRDDGRMLFVAQAVHYWGKRQGRRYKVETAPRGVVKVRYLGPADAVVD